MSIYTHDLSLNLKNFIEEISSAELASPKEGESLVKHPYYPISIQTPALFGLKNYIFNRLVTPGRKAFY